MIIIIIIIHLYWRLTLARCVLLGPSRSTETRHRYVNLSLRIRLYSAVVWYPAGIGPNVTCSAKLRITVVLECFTVPGLIIRDPVERDPVPFLHFATYSACRIVILPVDSSAFQTSQCFRVIPCSEASIMLKH